MISEHNFASVNAGVTFWMDIILPIMGDAFLIGWQRTKSGTNSVRSRSFELARA